MKLQQSCELYGLVAEPALVDYEDYREFDARSTTCCDRVDRLIYRLNARVFGQQLIIVRVVDQDRVRSAGMALRGLGGMGEYAWSVTHNLRQDRHWRCGLVEAMYRRYIERSIDQGEVPAELLDTALAELRRWE